MPTCHVPGARRARACLDSAAPSTCRPVRGSSALTACPARPSQVPDSDEEYEEEVRAANNASDDDEEEAVPVTWECPQGGCSKVLEVLLHMCLAASTARSVPRPAGDARKQRDVTARELHR